LIIGLVLAYVYLGVTLEQIVNGYIYFIIYTASFTPLVFFKLVIYIHSAQIMDMRQRYIRQAMTSIRRPLFFPSSSSTSSSASSTSPVVSSYALHSASSFPQFDGKNGLPDSISNVIPFANTYLRLKTRVEQSTARCMWYVTTALVGGIGIGIGLVYVVTRATFDPSYGMPANSLAIWLLTLLFVFILITSYLWGIASLNQHGKNLLAFVSRELIAEPYMLALRTMIADHPCSFTILGFTITFPEAWAVPFILTISLFPSLFKVLEI